MWSKDLNDYVLAISIDSEDNIYVGTGQTLLKFDSSGNLLWSFTADGYDYVRAVAVSETGTVYVGADKLYALDETGQRLWAFETDGALQKLAVGGDGTVYTSDWTFLYAVNPDGTQKWLSRVNYIRAITLGQDGAVYVGDYWDRLHAYAGDGSLKWQSETTGEGSGDGDRPERQPLWQEPTMAYSPSRQKGSQGGPCVAASSRTSC